MILRGYKLLAFNEECTVFGNAITGKQDCFGFSFYQILIYLTLLRAHESLAVDIFIFFRALIFGNVQINTCTRVDYDFALKNKKQTDFRSCVLARVKIITCNNFVITSFI